MLAILGRRCRQQKPLFWGWLVMALVIAATVAMWWIHLAHAAYRVEAPELTSASTLEDMRSIINRNSALVSVLTDRVDHIEGQQGWIMALLVSTLVLMVVELAKHFVAARENHHDE